MEQPKYKRVLLKISGEALAGEASRGLDFHVIGSVCDVVKKCVERRRKLLARSKRRRRSDGASPR